MKKLLIVLIGVLSFTFVNVSAIELPEVTDHEKVTLYMFRGSGCSHCHEALEYFNENYSKYKDYFNIELYEVWNNSYNSQLMQDVADKKGDEANGVPYFVLGSDFSISGFSESIANQIIETALKEYQNENYTDIVAEVKKGASNIKKESLEDALKDEKIIEDEKNTSNDTIIAVVIFAAIFGGIAGLVALSRKK